MYSFFLKPEELFKQKGWNRITRKIDTVVLHYSAVEGKKTAESVRKQLEAIRDYHVNNRGWKDIAYHIGVDLLGRYWALRNINEAGAHCKGHNATSVGVVLLANEEQLQSALLMEEALLRLFSYLDVRLNRPAFFLHRQLNQTKCPPLRREFEDRLRLLGYIGGEGA